MQNFKTLRRYLRWILLAALTGLLAGISASLLLILLEWATETRSAHSSLIWFLPLAGLGIGWIYHQYGKDSARGNNLILDEIHDPKQITPLRMAPLVLFATTMTHLFGGSAGREGTAVQMGASLADQLTRLFGLSQGERRILLVAGAGAGFSAAIGTPWAGVIFGMEVINVGRLRPFAVLECGVASFVAHVVAQNLYADASGFSSHFLPAFSWTHLAFVAVAGCAFGLAAQLFVRTTHVIEHLHARWVSYGPLKPFIGGLLLVAFYAAAGSERYAGLGLATIREALTGPTVLWDPLFKGLASAITMGSGFKGGEFVPLVFVGTTLGNALSLILPVPLELLASVGFAAVFAGAANTPIACTVMAAELFGWRFAPYALVGCYVSYWCSGSHGIYLAQYRDQKLPKFPNPRNRSEHHTDTHHLR